MAHDLSWHDYMDEKVQEEGWDEKRIKNKHREIISELEGMGFDDDALGWIYGSDILNAWEIRVNGFDSYMGERNHFTAKISGNADKYGTIVFPNKRLAVIWGEVSGQVSDGIWENDDRLTAYGSGDSKWEYYTFAHVKVRPNHKVTVQTPTRRLPRLNFKKKLTELEGMIARMIYAVRMSGVNRNYDRQDLMEDLKKLDDYEIEKA